MQKSEINRSRWIGWLIAFMAISFLFFAVSEFRPFKTNLVGSQFELAKVLKSTEYFAGKKKEHTNWLLVNFWASWCAPCREEMPQLEILSNDPKWKNKLTLLTLAQDQQAAPLVAYWKRFKFSMDGRIDSEQKISNFFGIQSYPTTLLVAPDNKIVKVWIGAEDWENMSSEIIRLMNL